MKNNKRFYLIALMMTCLTINVSSCGSPKTLVKIRNNAEGTKTDITVTQGEGGSTSVNVIPTISTNIDSIKFTTHKN